MYDSLFCQLTAALFRDVVCSHRKLKLGSILAIDDFCAGILGAMIRSLYTQLLQPQRLSNILWLPLIVSLVNLDHAVYDSGRVIVSLQYKYLGSSLLFTHDLLT